MTPASSSDSSVDEIQLDRPPAPGSFESSLRFQTDRNSTIENLTYNLSPSKVETSRKWTTKSADKETKARTSEGRIFAIEWAKVGLNFSNQVPVSGISSPFPSPPLQGRTHYVSIN